MTDVSERTRVPLRHLQAIETSNLAELPSPTYATGFTKAYARMVGVDEVAITRRLRGELAHVPRVAEYQPYEAPEPARVPSRGLAIVSLGLAIAVIVLAGLWFAGVLSRGDTAAVAPAATVADVPAAGTPTTMAGGPTPAATTVPTPTGGQVSLATTARVWLRVHDGDKTLYIGTMAPGDHFDVPAEAKDPLVDIGRPDKLTVTLNGTALPTLPPSDHPVKDLRIGEAAVAARLAGTGAPAPAVTTAPAGGIVSDGSAPVHHARASASRSHHGAHVHAARHAAAASPGDETARANLGTAPAAPVKTP